MKLIVELYVWRCVPEQIIIECIEGLLSEINETTVEILCQMILKLGKYLVQQIVREIDGERVYKPKKPPVINIEFVEGLIQKLTEIKKLPQISSRIKFKILDVQETYSKEWYPIINGDRKSVIINGKKL